MSLGLFIGNKLREKGVTLYFLAKATQISYPYLLAIEKGRRSNPSYDKLKKIATVLEIDIQELLEAGGFEGETNTTVVSTTVSANAPQRIPLIPWTWLQEMGNVTATLKTHTFRQFRYTQLKESELYAIELGKDLDAFSQGTMLVVGLNPAPKHGQLLLVKNSDGMGVYNVSQFGEDTIAIPQDSTKPTLAISKGLEADWFVVQIREAVVKF
jgi:transcriptional regulator with XRE-family HTH domain